MKAWIYRRYGGPEVLEWADLPDHVPGKGEIVVRVVAAALNPLDWKLRAGQYRIMTMGRLPRGVGCDYAGIVASVGEGVTPRVSSGMGLERRAVQRRAAAASTVHYARTTVARHRSPAAASMG